MFGIDVIEAELNFWDWDTDKLSVRLASFSSSSWSCESNKDW